MTHRLELAKKLFKGRRGGKRQLEALEEAEYKKKKQLKLQQEQENSDLSTASSSSSAASSVPAAHVLPRQFLRSIRHPTNTGSEESPATEAFPGLFEAIDACCCIEKDIKEPVDVSLAALKKLVRLGGEGAARAAFEELFGRLGSSSSRGRLAVLSPLYELTMRSKIMRELVFEDVSTFIAHTVGAAPLRHLAPGAPRQNEVHLPGPPEAAAALRRRGLSCISGWSEAPFAATYPSLRLAKRYLTEAHRLDLSGPPQPPLGGTTSTSMPSARFSRALQDMGLYFSARGAIEAGPSPRGGGLEVVEETLGTLEEALRLLAPCPEDELRWLGGPPAGAVEAAGEADAACAAEATSSAAPEHNGDVVAGPSLGGDEDSDIEWEDGNAAASSAAAQDPRDELSYGGADSSCQGSLGSPAPTLGETVALAGLGTANYELKISFGENFGEDLSAVREVASEAARLLSGPRGAKVRLVAWQREAALARACGLAGAVAQSGLEERLAEVLRRVGGALRGSALLGLSI